MAEEQQQTTEGDGQQEASSQWVRLSQICQLVFNKIHGDERPSKLYVAQVFSAITFVLGICMLVMGLIARSDTRELEQTYIYKEFLTDHLLLEYVPTLTALTCVSVVILINILVKFFSPGPRARGERLSDMASQLHFILAFSVRGFVILHYILDLDAASGANTFIATGTITNSFIMHGCAIKIIDENSLLFSFRISLIASLSYCVSTFLDTYADLFSFGHGNHSDLKTAALIFSFPLYILGFGCIRDFLVFLLRLWHRTPITDEFAESVMHSSIVFAFFICTRVISTTFAATDIHDLSDESIVAYSWLHVAFLVILSSVPNSVLSLRLHLISEMAEDKEEENVELRTLTLQLEKEKEKVLQLLFNMVPQQVALKLARGETVEPQAVPFSVIFFSDIMVRRFLLFFLLYSPSSHSSNSHPFPSLPFPFPLLSSLAGVHRILRRVVPLGSFSIAEHSDWLHGPLRVAVS